MLGTLSTIVVNRLTWSPHNCSAYSAVAHEIGKMQTGIVRFAERSQALFGRKNETISRLHALANDCADDDWDGNGAYAIEPATLLNAQDFVRALPNDVPLPECAPEPDGSISLDWIQSRNKFFSLSVGCNNRLAYAWLDGTDKGHGVVRFDGTSIPSRVLKEIKSIGK